MFFYFFPSLTTPHKPMISQFIPALDKKFSYTISNFHGKPCIKMQTMHKNAIKTNQLNTNFDLIHLNKNSNSNSISVKPISYHWDSTMLVIQLLAEKIEYFYWKQAFRLIETFRLFIKTVFPPRFIFMSASNVFTLEKSLVVHFFVFRQFHDVRAYPWLLARTTQAKAACRVCIVFWLISL